MRYATSLTELAQNKGRVEGYKLAPFTNCEWPPLILNAQRDDAQVRGGGVVKGRREGC